MKVLTNGPVPDRTVPLIEVWERAFVRPMTWRAALHAGMVALVAELRRDPEIPDACVLAQLPASVEGPVVWHRELTRGRILSVLTEHWHHCGGPRVPELTFEMFLGEVCTLLQDRVTTGTGWDDLPEETVALWGREPAAPTVRVRRALAGAAV